ncbi:MAG: DUF3570 domain-containing protein [Gammaproteobacteria bacterium]
MAAKRLCTHYHFSVCAGLALLLVITGGGAAVLPEDRADALYHSYDGGDVEISGPSLLVLKKFGQNVAVTGNYYVDSVSSASIDVVTTASPYSEERTEFSGSIDYLHGNSVMSLSYANSSESDYDANTAGFGISMDMFGNMTTLSLGYAHGWDTVRRSDLPTFSEDVRRHNYRLGVSQVITKDMILEVNYEGITDEGLLRNPYRQYRFLDINGDIDTDFEVYPNTRTSSAVTLRSKYYLPWRAALSGEYRFFADTWGIDAHTLKFGYTHPLSGGWQVEGTYRYYTQTAADFYSDLFPFAGSQNFLARDKELSTFTSNTIGAKLSYDIFKSGWRAIDRGSVNLAYDLIWFDYDDFRDARVTGVTPGTEPLYKFTAGVLQLFVSLWF